MRKAFRYTDKALDEQSLYKLNDNPEYQLAVGVEYSACERRKAMYGYWISKDTATKNMIKALRMMPWCNTAKDWARLHVTEGMMKLKD